MKPLYTHDCDACIFLGTWDKPLFASTARSKSPLVPYDLYVCPKEGLKDHTCCLARFGSDGPDYASITLENSVWDESLAAHDTGKERPSMYLCWMPELLECWRRAKMHTFHPNPDYSWGPVTGRISCAEPNMANIPVKSEEGARIHNAFFPNFTMQSTESDTVTRYTQALKEGKDPHRVMAAMIFGKSEDEVTPEERKEAKEASFFATYAIHDQVTLTVEEVNQGAMNWRERVARELRESERAEALRLVTADGYTFTVNADGSVGDGDLSWPSLQAFLDSRDRGLGGVQWAIQFLAGTEMSEEEIVAQVKELRVKHVCS